MKNKLKSLLAKSLELILNLYYSRLKISLSVFYIDKIDIFCSNSYINIGDGSNKVWYHVTKGSGGSVISAVKFSLKQAKIKIKEYNKYTKENKKRMFSSMAGTQKIHNILMKLAEENKDFIVK